MHSISLFFFQIRLYFSKKKYKFVLDVNQNRMMTPPNECWIFKLDFYYTSELNVTPVKTLSLMHFTYKLKSNIRNCRQSPHSRPSLKKSYLLDTKPQHHLQCELVWRIATPKARQEKASHSWTTTLQMPEKKLQKVICVDFYDTTEQFWKVGSQWSLNGRVNRLCNQEKIHLLYCVIRFYFQ